MSELTYIGTELELFSHARNWKSYLRAKFNPFLGGDVLEVGAGIGGTTQVLLSDRSRSWTALEPDPQLVEQFRARMESSPSLNRVETITGTMEALSPDQQFDCIIYVDVLEHIEADREEVELASRHLSQDGHLVVLSPAHQYLYSPFDKAIGHFRRYTKRSLRALTPPNLQLVSLRYLDCAGWLLSLANKLLLRQSMPTHKQIRFWDRFIVPVSRLMDPILRYSAGKSILGVWQRGEK